MPNQPVKTCFKGMRCLAYILCLYLAPSPAASGSPTQAYVSAGLHTLLPMAAGAWLHTRQGEGLQRAGSVLGIYGFAAGPSMGNYALDDMVRGTSGLMFRLAGAGLIGEGIFEPFYPTLRGEGGEKGRVFWMIALSSALWNLLSIPSSYREQKGPAPGTGLCQASISHAEGACKASRLRGVRTARLVAHATLPGLVLLVEF